MATFWFLARGASADQSEPLSTVADIKSKYSHENSERNDCSKPSGLKTHSAVPESSWKDLEDSDRFRTYKKNWQDFVQDLPDYHHSKASSISRGRGIVAASGTGTFNQMFISLRVLRSLGCNLPAEVWHFPGELNDYQKRMLATVNAVAKDTSDPSISIVGAPNSGDEGKRYAIKPASIINSAFEEVLFLDADNLLLDDPTFLFERQEFKETGAIFWPDFWRSSPRSPLYSLFNTPCYNEREFESGQMVINKRVSWKALNLAWYLNNNHAFMSKLLYGDKDTFRFAWKALKQPYHFIKQPPAQVGYVTANEQHFCAQTIGQHDPKGGLLFLHANQVKWKVWKGKYEDTHNRDTYNGFSFMRPWTHVQDLSKERDPDAVQPVWVRTHPKIPCLQYIRDEKSPSQPAGQGGGNEWGGHREHHAAQLVPHTNITQMVQHMGAWYKHYEDAEGPLFYISAFF